MKSQFTTRSCTLCFLLIAALVPSFAFGQRPFTAKDDIGLALFEYAGNGAPGGMIKYSPDGQYFAVVTERGRLDLNAPEDTIWVFRIEDVQRFVQHPEQGNPPTAQPLVQTATDRNGPLIETSSRQDFFTFIEGELYGSRKQLLRGSNLGSALNIAFSRSLDGSRTAVSTRRKAPHNSAGRRRNDEGSA